MKLKYIDTNILVRLITGDNPSLRSDALLVIKNAQRGELFLDLTVLTELTFILEFHEYKMKRHIIAEALKDLMSISQISSIKELPDIIDLYASHPKLDFTDAALLVLSKNNVVSFDKELNKIQKNNA